MADSAASSLARVLVASVEAERTSLAAAIHDGPLQLLAVALLELDSIGPAAEGPAEAVRAAGAELRRIMAGLAPLQMGPSQLGPALRDRLAALAVGASVSVSVAEGSRTAPEAAALGMVRLVEAVVGPSPDEGAEIVVSLGVDDSNALVASVAAEGVELNSGGLVEALAAGWGADIARVGRSVRISIPI